MTDLDPTQESGATPARRAQATRAVSAARPGRPTHRLAQSDGRRLRTSGCRLGSEGRSGRSNEVHIPVSPAQPSASATVTGVIRTTVTRNWL
jgi:hypothetical protein